MQKPKNNLAKQQKVFRQTKTTTPSDDVAKLTFGIFGILFTVTALATVTLLNTHVSADELPTTSASTTASVSVSAACSLAATGTDHSGTLTPGQFTGNIGTSDFTATCNDPNGYSIYAVGYSNDEWKNTNLIGAGNIGNIATDPDSGHKTSGDTSYWYMKLASGTAATTAGGATIVSPYNDYASIPSDYVKVATANSTTDGTTGTSFTSTYGVYIAPTQAPGTYVGKVRYTLVNPNNAPTYMQNLTAETCRVLASSGNFTVYDKRDNNSYTVRYLDDHCIMTQNLRYVGGDNGAVELGKAVNSAGETMEMTSSTEQNWVVPYYYNSGREDWGVYYNYCAASGEAICVMDVPNVSGNTTTSICPTNWGLPSGWYNETAWGGIALSTIESSGEFLTLAGYYGGEDGHLIGSGVAGMWWSSTYNSETGEYGHAHVYNLYLDNVSVRIGSTQMRRLMPVRCILSK